MMGLLFAHRPGRFKHESIGSMRVSDNLEENTSTFDKKLKQIITLQKA
jgi:hypothetical protein